MRSQSVSNISNRVLDVFGKYCNQACPLIIHSCQQSHNVLLNPVSKQCSCKNQINYIFNVLGAVNPDDICWRKLFAFTLFCSGTFFGPWRESDYCRHPVELTHKIGLQPDADVICSCDWLSETCWQHRHYTIHDAQHTSKHPTVCSLSPLPWTACDHRGLKPVTPFTREGAAREFTAPSPRKHKCRILYRAYRRKKRRNPAADSGVCQGWSCKEPSVGKSQGEPFV